MTIKEIGKQKELFEFIEWVALPTIERDPKSQEELAKKIGVDKNTLVNWKKVDGFWDEVTKLRKHWVKDRVSTVLMGLYGKAIKGGAQEVKLFLQYAEEFVEEIKIKKDEDYSPELIDKVINTLKNEGFTITPTNTGEQGNEKNSS